MYRFVENIIDPQYAQYLYTEYSARTDGNTVEHNTRDRYFPLNALRFYSRSGFNCFKLTENTSVQVNKLGRDAHMPWHMDGKFTQQATIYLNPEWNPEWGGLFEQEIDVGSEIITPKFCCGVVQAYPTLHRVTPITSDVWRLSVQIMQW